MGGDRMTRRARKQFTANAVAVIAWIGLAAVLVAFAGHPQAWAVVAASLVIQAATGGLR
jgi:hypothetical protein